MRAAVAYMPRGDSTVLVLGECSVAQGQGLISLFVFITQQMFSQYVCMCTTDSPKNMKLHAHDFVSVNTHHTSLDFSCLSLLLVYLCVTHKSTCVVQED